MIHCELLAVKELCPELSKVLVSVIKTVIHMRAGPFKTRLLVKLCEEMGAQYQPLLFYCNS
jgi:hypothetical protein